MTVLEPTPRLLARGTAPEDSPPCADLRFVVVSAQDRGRMLDHYLRLSSDDRWMRFMRTMSDEHLRTHVNTLVKVQYSSRGMQIPRWPAGDATGRSTGSKLRFFHTWHQLTVT